MRYSRYFGAQGRTNGFPIKSTNTVDVIYAAWPALLYTNPAIGRYLLEPVLAYQAANPPQGGYSVHDIGELARLLRRVTIVFIIHPGSSYPSVTGPSSGESWAV